MIRIWIAGIGLFLFSLCHSQTLNSNPANSFNIGLGAAFLGTGDLWIGKFNVGWNRDMTKYWSQEVSLNTGHANYARMHIISSNTSTGEVWYSEESNMLTTFHVDHNFFLQPFSSTRDFEFKIGTGYSLMYVSEAYGQNTRIKGQNGYESYMLESRKSIGGNAVLTFKYSLSSKTYLSLNGISQLYINGDLSNSLMIKFGFYL